MTRPTRKNVLRGAGVAVVVAMALVLWLLIDDNDPESPSSSGGAEVVSVASLQKAAAEQATPVYWAGSQDGAELELSRPEAGRTYVRYLTEGAEAGDPRADFLTVGTYEVEEAAGALRRQARETDGVLVKAPGGATVYFKSNQPQSVYMAYPGVDVEIEVYDPDFKRALQLVNSGQIVSVG